ncbi:MAG: PspA/IM30 family protein, partial [Gammaproteobacteria bacterium]
MALITRVSRLFRSDLHAVLDRIEEPEVLLRQAIREMEAELSSDEQRIRLMK